MDRKWVLDRSRYWLRYITEKLMLHTQVRALLNIADLLHDLLASLAQPRGGADGCGARNLGDANDGSIHDALVDEGQSRRATWRK